ncbi:MAG: serine/threonine protein kinase [Cyanobacteria bacterium SZAS LIN-5]|nr:serine/threonine protein kinase [Cyanobacteria bacterium SZAS LIN-5]RTL43111.1 MAG: serine/threonine protein kinase [Candidatus Melainabacteria bacterium]
MQEEAPSRENDVKLKEQVEPVELVVSGDSSLEPSISLDQSSQALSESQLDRDRECVDPSESLYNHSTAGMAFQGAGGAALQVAGSAAYQPGMASSSSAWDRPFDVNRAGFSPTVVASFQAILISVFVLILFAIFMQTVQTMGVTDWFTEPYAANTYIPPQFLGLTLKNIGNLDQVLAFLPFAFVGCCLLSGLVVYIARESRSRDIDWTDSHLMLEHSGPLTLAVRWSAIELVQQFSIWDIFNGKQPAFLIRTREGNQFKLKLSDISKKHNIGTFFSLIKTSAPKAALHVDPGFASDNSYTELWLKYFSVPAERQKTGMLENCMLLDTGRYEIIGTVGGGGQGTAYLANVCVAGTHRSETDENHIVSIDPANLVLNEQVVLKEYVLPVHRGQLTAERTAEKLRAEAEILQKLDHPQIVKLKDAFVEDFRGYLVLEYVSGESLKTLVERLGAQPETLVIDWALRTCDILEYMHGQSPPVVHRDITPDNLMLQEDGTVKIVDFNVAYQVDSSATSTVVGKHAYIPAEQFRGKAVPQSDIYSLGGTLFFLLTGKEPTPITQSHPRRVVSTISDEMDAIVARATCSSLSERYADITELRADLQKLAKRA